MWGEELVAEHVAQCLKDGRAADTILFDTHWLKNWCKEYNVSLRVPNKHFKISAENRKERLTEFLKNVWRVRYFFHKKYGKEIPIWSSDQMPLHRNEQGQERTLNVTGQNTYVKENASLSRERITVMTSASSQNSVPAPALQFVFKGKGVRVKLQPPPGVTVQWTDSGSYSEAEVLKFISGLPTIPAGLFPGRMQIFTLDDYSAHITNRVRQEFFKKGYILICYGGGITGDMQTNDTHLHRPSKKFYRQKECELMYKKLKEDPSHLPTPSRDEVMKMFSDAWIQTNEEVDVELAFKQNMITLSFDGKEDYLAKESLMKIVGEEMMVFRKELLKSRLPKNVKELADTVTPPKGTKRKEGRWDEGMELLVSYSDDEMASDGEAGEDVDSDISENEDEEMEEEEVNEGEGAEENDGIISNDFKLLNDVSKILEEGKKNASVLMMPFISKAENLVAETRRYHTKRLYRERLAQAEEEQIEEQIEEEDQEGLEDS